MTDAPKLSFSWRERNARVAWGTWSLSTVDYPQAIRDAFRAGYHYGVIDANAELTSPDTQIEEQP